MRVRVLVLGLSFFGQAVYEDSNWNYLTMEFDSDVAYADQKAGVHINSNNPDLRSFRANGGKVGPPFEGAPMMLLTTTGARSGQQRTTPLVHTRDGEDIVVLASKAGAPSHPAWYHNLVANPEVTVELGTEKFAARARVATGDERERLYAAQAKLMPNFAEYQQKTTRQIPVVVLKRIG